MKVEIYDNFFGTIHFNGVYEFLLETISNQDMNLKTDVDLKKWQQYCADEAQKIIKNHIKHIVSELNKYLGVKMAVTPIPKSDYLNFILDVTKKDCLKLANFAESNFQDFENTVLRFDSYDGFASSITKTPEEYISILKSGKNTSDLYYALRLVLGAAVAIFSDIDTEKAARRYCHNFYNFQDFKEKIEDSGLYGFDFEGLEIEAVSWAEVNLDYEFSEED